MRTPALARTLGLVIVLAFCVAADVGPPSPAERIDRVEQVAREFGPPPDVSAGNPAAKMTIAGTVRTADGKPAKRDTPVSIYIQYGNSSMSTQVALGGDGRFAYEGRVGTVVVGVMSSADYAPARAGPFTPKADGTLAPIDLVVDAGYPSHVRFVDPEGRPVPGVTAAGGHPRDRGYSHTIRLTSNAAGVATIARNGPLPMTLTATADGFQPDRKERLMLKADETFTWTLTPAKPTTGVVTSAVDGKPVAGAKIGLYRVEGPVPESGNLDNPLTLATTDDSGRFALRSLRSDSAYTLVVDSPDHAPFVMTGVRAGTADVPVRLGPPVHAAGRIVGPLASLREKDGRRVLTYTNPRTIDNSSYLHDDSVPVAVGPDGVATFRIDDLWPGEVTFSVNGRRVKFDVNASRDDLVLDFTPPPVADDDDPNDPTDDPLPPATRTVVLKVRVPPGHPPATGTVRFNAPAGGLPEQGTHEAKLKDGAARIQMFPPTTAYVKILDVPGYWFAEQHGGTDVPAGDGPIEIVADALPAGAVYGRLTDADGSPVSNAFVSVVVVQKWAGDGPKSLDLQLSPSTADGKFFAGPLPLGGRYALVAWPNRRVQVSESFALTDASPTRRVDVALAKGVTVNGRVVDEFGKGVVNAKLKLVYASPHSHAFGWSEIRPDLEGRFTFDKVNLDVPGSYKLTVLPDQGLVPAVVTLDPKQLDFTVTLDRGRVLAGTVVDDSTGKPVAGARVQMTPIYDEKASGYRDTFEAEGPSGADGAFRFSNLAPGRYRVRCDGRRDASDDGAAQVEIGEGGVNGFTFRVGAPW